VPVALESNPFVRKAKAKANPFIEKARLADLEVERLQEQFNVQIPDTPAGMLQLLETLDDAQLQDLLKNADELEQRLAEFGPQDDDELHAWIQQNLGINLPRTSVCPDHDPPFKFIADLYFERVGAVLAMGNRGGGKTLLVAILHWLNSLFKPGCESCTFGATEAQSLRCYAYLKGWIYDPSDGSKRPEVVSSLMRETIFGNTSRVEVLPGTPQAVNGPHPQKAHADEIELMDDGTWKESRNMTMSKVLHDGRFIKPQDVCTSTRKGPNGRMQKLIDEIYAAINAGFEPPRTLYQWCIKETSCQAKNCQVARPDLPEEEKCKCHRIRKGDWEDGSPRLLKHICKGDFYRSRGWQPFEDVIKQFTENDQETFETQQLCLKPEMKFHYLPKFAEAKHCFRNYEPDPRNGPIYTSVDWGGTNPHAVNWYQYLKFDIEVDSFVQPVVGQMIRKRIPAGSIICFDEIYKAEIGNYRLGQLVKLKEANYRRQWGGIWNATERFADPQGKAARTDWKNMGLKTSWHITREFEEHIKVISDLFEDNRFFVAGDKCPMWVREALEWRRQENTGHQLDTFNHCMSNFRYAVTNIMKLHKREEIKTGNQPLILTVERQAGPVITIRKPSDGPLGFQPRSGDQFGEWRAGLGQPIRAGTGFR
jgi:hypothetical protein